MITSISGLARESGIPNFFFLVGNLSAARVSSKVLALQIAAQQAGIFPERCKLLIFIKRHFLIRKLIYLFQTPSSVKRLAIAK